jgi:hypothetical protein
MVSPGGRRLSPDRRITLGVGTLSAGGSTLRITSRSRSPSGRIVDSNATFDGPPGRGQRFVGRVYLIRLNTEKIGM